MKHEFKFRGKLENTREDVLGLDFSPKNLYVDSNNKTGRDFGYVPQKQRNRKKLRRVQRRFSRKLYKPFKDKFGRYPNFKLAKDKIEFKKICAEQTFKNLSKAKAKLAKVNEKIANKRRYFQEIETKRLVRSYDKIVIEDLNLKGISSFLRNAKNMVDTSWGSFVSKLEQKGKYYNCKIVKADRYFPSSQICHCCGYQNHALTLNDRTWTCPNCNTHLDRDHNAAINLKNYKIPTKHRESTSAETENKTLETLATIALGIGAVDEAETENREISDKKAERL